MARTVEESIMNAIMGAFVNQKVDVDVNPTKSYMAIATALPKVGEHYKCRRLERKPNSNEIYFRDTETTTVQRVTKLACNIFSVTTRNSYYVTRVLYMPVEDVHFAVIMQEPENGSCMSCFKIECSGERIKLTKWKTTMVKEVRFIKGLYKVTTINSTSYICFPMR